MQQQVVQQQAVAAPQLRPLDVEAMWELFDFAVKYGRKANAVSIVAKKVTCASLCFELMCCLC